MLSELQFNIHIKQLYYFDPLKYMNWSAGCVHIIQKWVCVGLGSLLVKFERIDLLTSIFAFPLYSTNFQ
tara:strand:+ start:117 stop:323 length:207 start_codon:yes stop_codon:yes gene_type:complete